MLTLGVHPALCVYRMPLVPFRDLDVMKETLFESQISLFPRQRSVNLYQVPPSIERNLLLFHPRL